MIQNPELPGSAENRVAIGVAPVDYRDTSGFPTEQQLADDIVECCRAGASVVHFHVTDARGRPTLDTSFFHQVVRIVHDRCDIIIEGSTGGVGSTVEERSVALTVPGVEMASLNMGSCNLFGRAYVNAPEEVRAWAQRMRERKIVPDCCFFDGGFFTMLDWLAERELTIQPCIAGLCLGFPNALPATVENLVFMKSKLPDRAMWTLVQHGYRDFSLLAAAIACGGNIRVGFEDSPWLAPDQKARCNRELVEKARALIQHLGHSVATPAEMRRRFGLAPIEKAASSSA